jgi:hypothetical protein
VSCCATHGAPVTTSQTASQMGLEASKPLAAASPPDAPADADDPEPWNMLLRLALKVRAPHLATGVTDTSNDHTQPPYLPPPPTIRGGRDCTQP